MWHRVSVVVPCFNEEENIKDLIDEIFSSIPGDVLGELIIVDDCSTDDTAAVVRALLPSRSKLRLISHLKNAGQSRAVWSGVSSANFPVVATLDGDGQNPPSDLLKLIEACDDERKLVGGCRIKRQDSLSKRAASRAANLIRRFVLRDNFPDTGCGLKVFSREAYMTLPFFNGQHRYLPALMQANGYTAVYLPVGHRPRRRGQSKYTNMQRALVGIFDVIGVAWLIRRARYTSHTEDRSK